MIYLDPEEEHEVLTLKKVLASTLSAKVVVSSSEEGPHKPLAFDQILAPRL